MNVFANMKAANEGKIGCQLIFLTLNAEGKLVGGNAPDGYWKQTATEDKLCEV